jgi:hypothetical protein
MFSMKLHKWGSATSAFVSISLMPQLLRREPHSWLPVSPEHARAAGADSAPDQDVAGAAMLA